MEGGAGDIRRLPSGGKRVDSRRVGPPASVYWDARVPRLARVGPRSTRSGASAPDGEDDRHDDVGDHRIDSIDQPI